MHKRLKLQLQLPSTLTEEIDPGKEPDAASRSVWLYLLFRVVAGKVSSHPGDITTGTKSMLSIESQAFDHLPNFSGLIFMLP
ncbi:hypothetical protein KDW_49920 [Dictyobacter vulcani]|uniref:Uncharacterized protein n=1 Tax=Dictyobacter vulcani TaxID=2607529 RepID=A0A5J4KWC5_9CHLR|nr:hypothetical protein [Dictyobacter vulcani]GER90830.1 hypothetical protein KDW_49920 [Dictyobacter vulcani]